MKFAVVPQVDAVRRRQVVAKLVQVIRPAAPAWVLPRDFLSRQPADDAAGEERSRYDAHAKVYARR